MFNVQHNLCDNVTNYCLSKIWAIGVFLAFIVLMKNHVLFNFPMLKDEINDFIIIVIYSLTIKQPKTKTSFNKTMINCGWIYVRTRFMLSQSKALCKKSLCYVTELWIETKPQNKHWYGFKKKILLLDNFIILHFFKRLMASLWA